VEGYATDEFFAEKVADFDCFAGVDDVDVDGEVGVDVAHFVAEALRIRPRMDNSEGEGTRYPGIKGKNDERGGQRKKVNNEIREGCRFVTGIRIHAFVTP
jgi:hypothetical protein